MAERQVVTYCRICEPLCGLVATVQDDRLVRLRPDPDHPLSRGFACPKGIAMAEVQNDPDRVLHPLRRLPSGEFERVSWDEALDGIADRLRGIPRDGIGWYFGNPATFSYSHPIWMNSFMAALGSKHIYSAGSQDVNNRFAASALLYGSPLLVPIPDLKRTELLLMLGANPLVSHGSLISEPRIKERLAAVPRVIVVDPRRTETARAHEHLPIRPDGDAWLLLSLLQVIFAEGLAKPFEAAGTERFRALVAGFTPETTAERTGIDAAAVRALARDLATADHAAVYGRIGSCLGRSGTLTAFLIDALNLVTGNLDRPGGVVFGRAPLRLDELARISGLATYAAEHSRVGGYPDVLGTFPAGIMAREITTPGDGRLRALFVSAGNPVNSVPGGLPVERLDLLVCLDFYVSDTAKHADYILPATTFLEREDFPLPFGQLHLTPYATWTEAVVPPRGEARQEWQVIEDLARRMGVPLGALGPQRLAHRLGVRPGPRLLLDLLLRTGPERISIRKLRKHPHGIVLAEHQPTGTLGKRIRHKDRKVHLAPPEIVGEIERLTSLEEPEGYPLRLIGLRELRSHNSWMHNVPGLMRGRRTHLARISPQDAAAHGIEDGATLVITSPHGRVELPAKITDEMIPGTIAVPHGWGHTGGWPRANAAGGANVNTLASPDDLEPLAGMARLNGVPVRIAAG